jgi:hypothetical protein
MNKLFIVIIIFLLPISSLADIFDDIKIELSKDGCWHFIFVDVIESEIFNTVDTTYGEAYMSSDGRYYIETNDEFYIYDHDNYFSYSPESNQLIIEKRLSSDDDNISFITNLNKYYDSNLLTENRSYSLLKKDNIISDVPDSMIVYINSDEKKLEKIEYFDINDELNKLIFIEQNYIDSCLDNQFIPVVPDSTERVKL